MPRTKRPTNKKEKVDGGDETTKKLNQLLAEQMTRIDINTERCIRSIEMAFKIKFQPLSSDILQKTVGELRNKLYLPPAPDTSCTSSSRPASQDDGYLTENTSQGSGDRRILKPKAVSRPTTRRSRSADTSSRKTPATSIRSVQKRRSISIYRTPACPKGALNAYPTITPKVSRDTALSVLRQPRLGETVVSLDGSPVMVPNYTSKDSKEKAHCNIMLEDGTLLSLQPKPLRTSQVYVPLPLMSDNVFRQMEILKDNLEAVMRLREDRI